MEVTIEGTKFTLIGTVKENNFMIYLLLAHGQTRPHALLNNGDKYKLFGPLGNSLPAKEIELVETVLKVKNSREANYV